MKYVPSSLQPQLFYVVTTPEGKHIDLGFVPPSACEDLTARAHNAGCTIRFIVRTNHSIH